MKRFTVLLATVVLAAAACGDGNPIVPPGGLAPTVTSTLPASAAIGVPRNVAVTATFSTAMDPATINATTFRLVAGSTAIVGVVTYVGTTATLIPTSTLASNTVFTATISIGARNVAGTALATARTWTFTTTATSATGPSAVNLRTAGNYVILAKSQVSTTGATSPVPLPWWEISG